MLAIPFRPANELNDLCAHDNPSHTAIATRPASASEIRYAVMPGPLDRIQICGMTALMRSFQARTLSLQERPRADADPVRAARRRVRAHRLISRHDPEKCDAVFRWAKCEVFARRSCPTCGSDGSAL